MPRAGDVFRALEGIAVGISRKVRWRLLLFACEGLNPFVHTFCIAASLCIADGFCPLVDPLLEVFERARLDICLNFIELLFVALAAQELALIEKFLSAI